MYVVIFVVYLVVNFEFQIIIVRCKMFRKVTESFFPSSYVKLMLEFVCYRRNIMFF